MIGIPPVGSQGHVDFCISFWAALYSGLIYSIVTGIIVGLIIWRMQARVEKRTKRTENERVLYILKLELKYMLKENYVLDLSKPNVPSVVEDVYKLLLKYPIDSWNKLKIEDKKLIDSLKELRTDYLDCISKYKNLEMRLNSSIRNYNCSKGRIQTNDAAIFIYYIGRSFGYTPENIAPFIGIGTSNSIPAWVEEGFNIISGDDELSGLKEAYVVKRTLLINNISEISKCLNEKN